MKVSEKTNKQQNNINSALNLLGRTLALYKTNFNLYFGYAAWLFVPMILVILAFVTLDANSFELINIFLSLFSVLILAIWVQIMTVQLTYIFEKKKIVRIKKLSANGWTLLIPYLLISIVIGIITMIGFIALIIPGIIIGIILIFAPIIVVIEKKPLIESIKQSYKLAKKDFAGLFIKIAVGCMAIFTLYGIGIIAIYAVGWSISGIDVISYLQAEPALLEDLLLNTLSIFLIPILSIFHTLLYLDAKS